MDPAPEAPTNFEFGRFRILSRHREVLADGQPLQLGGRAFDVLLALIEANGAVVSKDDLMKRAWPDRIVEENNLHAQIKALRKAFSGQDVIRTIVGRGYQFKADIRVPGGNHSATPSSELASEALGSMGARTNLPAQTSDLIGRVDQIEELIGLVADHRFITLTGPGASARQDLPSN